MSTENPPSPNDPAASAAGAHLAQRLEQAYDARTTDESTSWINEHMARLGDWRAAAHQELGLTQQTAVSERPESSSSVLSVNDAVESPAIPLGDEESSRAKVRLGELMSGAHLSRGVMSRVAARLAARQERHEQRTPEDARRHRLRKNAAIAGALVTSFVTAKYMDLPPILISPGMPSRLSRSPNVAATGTLSPPDGSDRLTQRLQRIVANRRSRKRS